MPTLDFEEKIWEAIASVCDPEIPVISIVDMGIVSNVIIGDSHSVDVKITPTFTGCPAIETIKTQVSEAVLKIVGVGAVTVESDFTTAWNSNRITEKGKAALKGFGLAPPPVLEGEIDMAILENVACPFCDSENTSMNTPFGPTLCRSLHYCHNCKQAFEQFKPVG